MMPINEKDYNRILNELNKEYEVKEFKETHPIANAIIIVILGLFIGYLAVMVATQ